MRALILASLVLISGCAVGFRGGIQPSGVYQTVPPARPYEEVRGLESTIFTYGLIGQDVREAAVARLLDRAQARGADAVIDVRVNGGCRAAGYVAWLFLLPNCTARASGIGVRWVATSEPVWLSVEAR